MDRRVLVVNGKGGSEYTTITEAVKASVDGDTILVRVGQYEEKLVLDKSVSIIAEDHTEVADIIISGGVVITQGSGSIKNISIQQALEIRGGTPHIEGCDVSQGSDGIRVLNDSNPHISKCSIHGAQSGGDGIYFGKGSKGTVEECDIHSNRVNGIHVNGAEVVLRQNKIHDCPYGMYFRNNGKGVAENNIVDNVACFGIYVVNGADPLIVKNNVLNCAVHGVMISSGGSGNFKDNTVHGSVRILRGCMPTLGVNTFAGRIDNENNQPLAPPPGVPVA